MLGAQELAASLLARLATGHLLALLAFVMALLAPLLLLGSSLGRICSNHLSDVLLRLPVIHGHGRHSLRAVTLPLPISQLGQLLDVSQLNTSQMCLNGH